MEIRDGPDIKEALASRLRDEKSLVTYTTRPLHIFEKKRSNKLPNKENLLRGCPCYACKEDT